MNDDIDPILDSCLDEVLGGQSPPDMSDRILREWSRLAAGGSDLPEGVLPPLCDSPPVQTSRSGVRGTHPATTRRNRRVTAWTSVALALSLVIVISTSIVLQLGGDRQSAPEKLAQENSAPEKSAQESSAQEKLRSAPGPAVAQQVSPRSAADPSGNSNESISKPSPATSPVPVNNPPSLVRTPDVTPDSTPERDPFAGSESVSASKLVAAPNLPAPKLDGEVVEQINKAVRAQWTARNVSVPQFISDSEWQRRVFQVVLGREPTNVERQRFRGDTPDARSKLVASLTSSDEYLAEFAKHWSEYFTDEFLPPDLLEGGSLAQREGMLQYFRRALLDRRPFDRMATELLTATGTGVPGEVDYNGATNFLLARVGGRLEHATADTARLMLGRNIECQQCHADPKDNGRQQQEFWELNAFFRQLAATRKDQAAARLADVDFMGEDNKDGSNAIVFYERPDGLLKGAYPAFAGHADLPKSGIVGEVNRRELLAKVVTGSPAFRQAATNRLWVACVGRGLASTENLDSHDPLHHELLVELGDQFAANQFDPRRVIMWATLSEPFAVPEASSSSLVASSAPLFQTFQAPKRVPRLGVQESLVAAAKTMGQPASNAATTAKVDDTSKTVTKNGKIVLDTPSQSPLLIGSQATYSVDPLARKVLDDPKLSNQQKAEHLFQIVLHRMPRRREIELVERCIQQAGDKPHLAWDAIWRGLHP